MKTNDGRTFHRASSSAGVKKRVEGHRCGSSNAGEASEFSKQCHAHAEGVNALLTVQGRSCTDWDPKPERARANRKRIRLMQIKTLDDDEARPTGNDIKESAGDQEKYAGEIVANTHDNPNATAENNNAERVKELQIHASTLIAINTKHVSEIIAADIPAPDDMTQSKEGADPKRKASEHDI